MEYRLEAFPGDGGPGRLLTRGPVYAGAPAASASGAAACFAGGELLLFAPDGSLAAKAGSGGSWRRCVAFSPDGRHFVSGPSPLEVWGVDGRLSATITYPDGRAPLELGFTADGRVVAAREDGYDLFSVEGGPLGGGEYERAQRIELVAVVGGKVFSPTSPASGVLADAATGRTSRLMHAGRRVAFSPGGGLVALYGGAWDPGVEVLGIGGDDPPPVPGAAGEAVAAALADGGAVAWIERCAEPDGPWSRLSLRLRAGRTGGGPAASAALPGELGADGPLLAMAPDGRSVAAASSSCPIVFLYDGSCRELGRLEGHGAGICSLAFAPDGRRLVSASWDGTLRLWDTASGKSVVLCSAGGDWLAYTDDGYFDASPSGGRLVALVDGLEAYGIEQTAVARNRPDILLSRLGLGSPEEIAYYRGRYVRRLVKAGAPPTSIPKARFEEELAAKAPPRAAAALSAAYRAAGAAYALRPDAPLGAKYELLSYPPYLRLAELALESGGPPPTASIVSCSARGLEATLVASAAAGGADLASYNVYVDGVPLWPGAGKPLGGRSADLRERIELAPGPALVELSCLDAAGLESARAAAWVVGEKAAAGRGDLYFVGFGVSAYDDPELRLAYPRKDAEDLAQALGALAGSAFERVRSRLFVDRDCDRSALALARAFLAQAKVEDAIVLFISGHGVHAEDPAATYYYLTREASLRDLPGTALDFEALEGLLAGVAPRRKLFLMDSCESGDYEAAARPEAAAETRPRAIPGSRGLAVAAAAPPPRALARDRYVNNDLFRRTGAVVFSSSRGGELSYEPARFSPDGNGFFTGAVLAALGTLSADADGDGSISVAELQAYVAEAVARRSGGRQHPIIDRDNSLASISFALPERFLSRIEDARLGPYLAAVARRGDPGRLEALLRLGPAQSAKDGALLAAAAAGREQAVRALLSAQADPRAADPRGYSASRLALAAGSPAASLAIAEAGAALPAALVAAAREAGLEAGVAALIAKGSPIEREGRQDAFVRAASRGDRAAAAALAGAGVDLAPAAGFRPAACAASAGQRAMAAELEGLESLLAGLLGSVEAGDAAAARRFLDAGAPLNCRAAGQLPLVEAARLGRLDLLRLLLDAGADPEARDGLGRRALDIAIERGDRDSVILLEGRRSGPPPRPAGP